MPTRPEQHQGAGRTALGGRGVARRGRSRGCPCRRRARASARGRPRARAPAAGAAGRPGRCRPRAGLRGAHPAHAVGELRQHGDRDDQRGADLVERGRHRAEQPLGVGQRVGGADADHDGGEPEPVVQREEQRLRRRSGRAGVMPGDPVGQRDRRQVEQHRAAEPAAEDEPERHPDHDDHDAEPDVDPERLAPRLVGAAQRRPPARRPRSASAGSAGWS